MTDLQQIRMCASDIRDAFECAMESPARREEFLQVAEARAQSVLRIIADYRKRMNEHDALWDEVAEQEARDRATRSEHR